MMWRHLARQNFLNEVGTLLHENEIFSYTSSSSSIIIIIIITIHINYGRIQVCKLKAFATSP